MTVDSTTTGVGRHRVPGSGRWAMIATQHMGQSIVVVDAFATQPFTGNPAAVCVLDCPRDERWMQLVAREMNLSETAFLLSEGDVFRLRWFTPTVEVDLCGHATLASAHVLWESGRLRETEEARFHTRSGLLTARRKGDRIVMDFPAAYAQPCEAPPGLAEAIGAPLGYTAKNAFDYLGPVPKIRPAILAPQRRERTRGNSWRSCRSGWPHAGTALSCRRSSRRSAESGRA